MNQTKTWINKQFNIYTFIVETGFVNMDPSGDCNWRIRWRYCNVIAFDTRIHDINSNFQDIPCGPGQK